METPHTQNSVTTPMAVESVSPSQNLESPEETPSNKAAKKHSTLIAIFVSIIILLGAGYYVYTTYYDKGGIVAVVNGSPIYATELVESITLIEQSATLQGIDITEESIKAEIRSQALDTLINNTLILTSARDAGFEVKDDEIDEKYNELALELGGEETLRTKMQEIGLTEERLRKNIEERVLSDKLLETETTIEEITVTDEEIANFVKLLNEEGQELPPLDQIRPQIEAQILVQKQQQVVLDFLANLKASAKIDIRE